MRIKLKALLLMVAFHSTAHAECSAEALAENGLEIAADGTIFRPHIDYQWAHRLGPDVLYEFETIVENLSLSGTELLLLPLPNRGLSLAYKTPSAPILTQEEGWAFYQRYRDDLIKTGIITPDLAPIFANLPNSYYMQDHHWRPEAAEKTAEIISKAIEAKISLGDQDNFSLTYREESISQSGLLSKLPKDCRDLWPAEPYHRPIITRTGGLSLLDIDEGPTIILLGTSFSAVEKFGFPGFLSKYFGHEVNNQSISGGGLMTSALAYFSSEIFRSSPPDLIIWEYPIYYDFNSELAALRSVAAVTSSKCLAHASGTGWQKLAQNQRKSLLSHQSALLKLPTRILRETKVTLHTQTGAEDPIAARLNVSEEFPLALPSYFSIAAAPIPSRFYIEGGDAELLICPPTDPKS